MTTTDETEDAFTVPRFEPLGAITKAHRRWLTLPQEERVYNAKALRFVRKALGGGYRKERTGRISVSGLGYCVRQQQLRALGVPEDLGVVDFKSMLLMEMGTWSHLRWQAEGLTVGWLQRAEVFVRSAHKVWPLGGSIDGILSGTVANDEGFELKTTNYKMFNKVRDHGNVTSAHLMQVSAYLYLKPALRRFRMVHEERGWADVTETVIERDYDLQSKVIEESSLIRSAHLSEELLPVLEDCWAHKGKDYDNCHWKDTCMKLRDYDDVAERLHQV